MKRVKYYVKTQQAALAGDLLTVRDMASAAVLHAVVVIPVVKATPDADAPIPAAAVPAAAPRAAVPSTNAVPTTGIDATAALDTVAVNVDTVANNESNI